MKLDARELTELLVAVVVEVDVETAAATLLIRLVMKFWSLIQLGMQLRMHAPHRSEKGNVSVGLARRVVQIGNMTWQCQQGCRAAHIITSPAHKSPGLTR